MNTEFFQSVPPQFYEIFLFFSVFIENIFPPYPGDSVVVFSGYLLQTGTIELLPMVLIILVGNLSSAALMYFFGHEVIKFFLKHIKSQALKEVFSEDHMHRTHDWFNRYGIFTVIFSRFSAGIRFFIAIVAGMVEMHIALFLTAFTIATILWNVLLVSGGYYLGSNWEELLSYVRIYSGVVAFVVIAVALGFMFYVTHYADKKKTPKKREDSSQS